jgi:hypothetical protein
MGFGCGYTLFTGNRLDDCISGARKQIPHDTPIIFMVFDN